jgi:dipeptidyl aminopeptidase/acylaminoacyl peptidase
MPWDETLLCIADFDAELNVRNTEVIAGGVNESVCQPKFNKLGEIYFVSDRNNWWNIYKYQAGKIQPVAILDAELGGSIFRLGSNTYEFTDTHNLICIVNAKEHYSLALISENNIKMLNTHLDYFASTLATEGDYVYAVAANAASAPTLIRLNLQNDQIEVVHSSSSLLINADYLSLPQMVEFPTANNLTAFAYFYAPHNPRFEGLPDELPPLIVITHGGPTAASNSALNLKIQYWTSRGFAVLDVNYGGSTGYGRAYRERLNQNWGIVDVEDCVNAAKYLVQQGKVDGKRLIIKGGSAGGFTVLSALTFYDIFAAGASYYGVADLAALVQETHKFEARYLDKLIGAYPEQKQIYFDRSPLHHAEKLSCPIIFFQGLEDKVVPPAQTEAMIAAMEKKSLPYAYLTFPHEQHGFRDVYSIKTSLEAELSFYSQIFNFKPADDIKFVPVKNWS